MAEFKTLRFNDTRAGRTDRLKSLTKAYDEGFELLTTMPIADVDGETYKIFDTLIKRL